MEELKSRVASLIQKSKGDRKIIESLEKEEKAPPFSRENCLLAYFLSIGELSFEAYLRLWQDYVSRNQKENRYLYLFDMAPRTFGQTWGERHIMKLFPEFVKATRENLLTEYPNFDGEFDLWIEGRCLYLDCSLQR